MKKREKGLAVKSKASTIFSTVVSLFLNRRWIWFFFLFNSSINSYKPKKKKGLRFHINKVLIFQVFMYSRSLLSWNRWEIASKAKASLVAYPKMKAISDSHQLRTSKHQKKRLQNKGSWFMNFLTKDLFRSL